MVLLDWHMHCYCLFGRPTLWSQTPTWRARKTTVKAQPTSIRRPGQDFVPFCSFIALAEPDSHHPRHSALGTIQFVLQDSGHDLVLHLHVLAPETPTSVVGEVQLCIIRCVDCWSCT